MSAAFATNDSARSCEAPLRVGECVGLAEARGVMRSRPGDWSCCVVRDHCLTMPARRCRNCRTGHGCDAKTRSGSHETDVAREAVAYLDARVVGVLLGIGEELRSAGRSLVLVAPSSAAARLLGTLGLDRILDIRDR